MKLLFDQNVDYRLVRRLADLRPESVHVRDAGMKSSPDEQIWDYAARHDFVIVTKDSDFRHRSAQDGHPPKVIWIGLGNCSTQAVEAALRRLHPDLLAFHQNNTASLLEVSD